MNVIKRERLGSVEPITKVVGITEDGDMLIEDRNGVRYSLPAALVEGAKPSGVVYTVFEPQTIVWSERQDPTSFVPTEPEPAPKPKRKPRAKKAK